MDVDRPAQDAGPSNQALPTLTADELADAAAGDYVTQLQTEQQQPELEVQLPVGWRERVQHDAGQGKYALMLSSAGKHVERTLQ